MIYNIEFETLPRKALEAIQLRRLQEVVERVYATVPFYRQKFQEAGVTPAGIQSLQDLERKITKNVKEYLGVPAKVKLVEPKRIARSEGKAQRVIDHRSI